MTATPAIRAQMELDLAPHLPPQEEMVQALWARDAAYEGVFLAAVKTTGIFCRPTCGAKKPKAENVEFFATTRDALLAGYRACQRCRPLEPLGAAPDWLRPLLREVDADPTRRWREEDLRASGCDPDRVRRWFQSHHGMTFHAYIRARRLGMALGRLRHGDDTLQVAFDSGYESLSGFNDAFKQLFGTSPSHGKEVARALVTRILTPLGPMLAAATETGVCLLEFTDRRMLEVQLRRVRRQVGGALAPGSNAHLDRLAGELRDYFGGELRAFTVPLVVAGSDFQRAVWDSLRRIPYGETCSYADIARRIGRPAAVRAVGRANGDNRIAIVIPCHRVVGSDGELTGYGGGLWRKRALLALEQQALSAGRAAATTAGRRARVLPSS
jgi:AraC family transcriptional regulator, regulatory protein of adaptative response / methylated-DNA-[protein]-cysteine methyltransferase